MRFEDLIRSNVKEGRIVEALGREEEFIRERLEQHRNPKSPIIRRLSDGNWYILKETRTPEGGIALTFVDITDLKNAESALRDSEKQFRTVVDSSPNAVSLKDQEGRYLLVNKTFASWMNLDPEDIVGKTAFDLHTKEEAEEITRDFDEVFLSLKPSTSETQRTYLDGKTRDVIIHRCPIRTETGEAVAVNTTTIDNSERQQVQRALKKSQEEHLQHLSQLEKVLRVTTVAEMASAFAHQLNQPLGAVANYCRGFLHQLESGKWTEDELKGTFRKVVEQSDRAATIVRDIADFIGGSEGETSDQDINQIVLRAALFLKPELNDLGVELELGLSDVSLQSKMVPVEIEQVIINLVMNSVDAFRAKKRGKRELTLRTALDGAGIIRVSVLDTGGGIAPEMVANLFKPFTSTKPDGMGMGLAISQTIVEKHGGRIWAGNNGRRGAAFHFTLPITEEALPR